MKFSKLRQLLLVSAIGLVVATLFSGCSLVTIDYLFVSTSASQIGKNPNACPAGEIETYASRFPIRRSSFRRSTGLLWWHFARGPRCLARRTEPLCRQPG